ncbi:MAG: 3-phosphoshikimate 1-carboxyvinyltransferase [Spirochaetia bacterium]|nr:3-phosphoshikimate 1-carboxyvinyltransferase [Spirochaetia bacterium]
MKKIHLPRSNGCIRTVNVQGDKSLSHRAVIIGSLAKGVTRIDNFLEADDTLNTIKVYKDMGVKIEKKGASYLVHGKGLNSLRQPQEVLYTGNSGTGIRLTLGVLAAQPFTTVITGDKQIVKRPMDRVMEPLMKMGAKFEAANNLAPVTVYGGNLHGMNYRMPMASAQVKSAIILAALHASGDTVITEPVKSRDHTERMLKYFGASVSVKGRKITVKPGVQLKAKRVFVPGDLSSAAYFIMAGLMMKKSIVTVKNIGLNPTRTGLIEVIKKMGGRIRITNMKNRNNEPVGDIVASTSNLKGITIGGALIPKLIDEIPVIAVAAAFATGRTVIRDAQELRFKETDRINTVVTNLKRIGIKAEALPDGMVIHGNGGKPFKYADIDSFGDHRIAMAFSAAALVSESGLLIKDIECVNTSFPRFFSLITSLEGKK